MNIKISSVADRGVAKKERVVLKVLSATDIGEYALFRTRVNDDGVVTIDVRNVYWFPDKTVFPGDVVVLYTKDGVQSEKLLSSGKTSHFFYWDLPEPLWEPGEDAVVLLHIEDWTSYNVPT